MENKKFIDWRESSRKNWGTNVSEGNNLSEKEVQTGALLRIADATEAMAKNHNQLIRDLETYKRIYNLAIERENRLIKRVNAYKGHLRKAKEKLATIEKSINPIAEEKFLIHKSSGRIGRFVALLRETSPRKDIIILCLQSGEIFSAPFDQFKEV